MKVLIRCLLASGDAVESCSIVGGLFFVCLFVCVLDICSILLLHLVFLSMVITHLGMSTGCSLFVTKCAHSEFCGETMVVSFTYRDEHRVMR